MDPIGKRIRTLRLKRGWTLRTLAIKTGDPASGLMGYTENTIGDVERGKYPPSERVLRAIEKAFGEKLRR